MKKLILICCLFFISSQVYAHKLNVFAFVEGNQVNVEGYFSDGIPARNAKITVTDKEGNLVYEGRADEKGQHQFQTPQQSELLIKIDAGLGHIGIYHFGADDVAAAKSSSASMTSTAGSASSADIQKAVTEAIKPLAREISELKQKSRMSDIIGGIGYIFGILGLFAYLKYRKESQNS